MNRHIITGIILVFIAAFSVTAQTDTTKKGTAYFKSIRIIGNDTLIEEKNFDFGDEPGQQGFNFRFDTGGDSLFMDGSFRGFRFDSDDSLSFDGMFPDRITPGIHPFNTDSLLNHFRFSFPEIDIQQGKPFHFEFKIPDGEGFREPVMPGLDLFRQGNFPMFSVEDVAIYPESNTVRNFVIKPVAAAGIFLIEAELSNKKSEYTVYDQRGKVIASERFRSQGGTFKRVLTLQELGSGTYFVEVKNGRSIKKKRLTIR